MVLLVVVILGVSIIYFMMRGREARSAEVVRAARDVALDVWCLEQDVHAGAVRYTLHFPTMALQVEVFSDEPGDNSREHYMVRRNPDGVWQSLASIETRDRDIKRLQQLVALPLGEAKDRKRLKRLTTAWPAWERIDIEIATMIETAYQRHIHQPRS